MIQRSNFLVEGSPILVDMDDVLAAFIKECVGIHNYHFPNNKKTIDNISDWNFVKCLNPDAGNYMEREKFFLNLDPIPGAVGGMKYLIEDLKLNVFIVTATPLNLKTAHYEKVLWIKEHLPFFNVSKNFMSVHAKQMIKGKLLFDDGLHNLSEFDGIRVCFDKPWNKNDYCSDIRVKSWSEFISFIDKIYI